jgi:hypothetical protein
LFIGPLHLFVFFIADTVRSPVMPWTASWSVQFKGSLDARR